MIRHRDGSEVDPQEYADLAGPLRNLPSDDKIPCTNPWCTAYRTDHNLTECPA